MSVFIAGGPEHVGFWDAIDEYARERGAKNFNSTHVAIQRSVARVERAARAAMGPLRTALTEAVNRTERRELDALAELDEANANAREGMEHVAALLAIAPEGLVSLDPARAWLKRMLGGAR